MDGASYGRGPGYGYGYGSRKGVEPHRRAGGLIMSVQGMETMQGIIGACKRER